MLACDVFAQPGRRVQAERIFLFGFAVTLGRAQNQPKKSKEMQGFFLVFTWIYLHVTRPKVASVRSAPNCVRAPYSAGSVDSAQPSPRTQSVSLGALPKRNERTPGWPPRRNA